MFVILYPEFPLHLAITLAGFVPDSFVPRKH